jgi:hypothetical protein
MQRTSGVLLSLTTDMLLDMNREDEHPKAFLNLILTLGDRRAYPILIELKSAQVKLAFLIFDLGSSGHIVFPIQLGILHSLGALGSARYAAMT